MDDILGMGKVESKSKPVNCKMHAQSVFALGGWTCYITDCPCYSWCPFSP